ncbi:MAG: flagellar basal body protein, partial [Sphingobium sp.]
MDRLVNTALTAMRGAMARQSAIANNLANVNTVGFPAEVANAETRWIKGDSFDTRAQQAEQVIAADMAQGAITATGNPLDVARKGDALRAGQATDRSETQTRGGARKRSHSGRRQTRA